MSNSITTSGLSALTRALSDYTYSKVEIDDKIQPVETTPLNVISETTPNTGPVNMNNKKITNLAEGTVASDAVTKAQLDVVANRVVVNNTGTSVSIQQKDQEALTQAVALGALSGVVSTGVSALLGAGGIASIFSIGSLAPGALTAASVFTGILDTATSSLSGLKTMNKKDFDDLVSTFETDPSTQFTEYEDWADDLKEELKQDNSFNALISDWTTMNKLLVKEIAGVKTYFLPMGGAAGPYSAVESMRDSQVPTFGTLKQLVGTEIIPGDLAMIYAPWSAIIDSYQKLLADQDLDMNGYEIKRLKKIIDYGVANQQKAVSLETMIEYISTQISGIASNKIKDQNDTCSLETDPGAIITRNNNRIIQRQYYTTEPDGFVSGRNVLDSAAVNMNTQIKGRFSNRFTTDRPGFQKDTIVSSYEENAMYSDPVDRTGSDMINPDPLRVTTRRYNDATYRKQADALPIPAKIEKDSVKIECFANYIGIQDQNQQQMLYVQSSEDTKIRTTVAADASNTLDLQSYEGVRLKETYFGTTIADFQKQRIDLNKPVFLAAGIDIDQDQQLATKLYVDQHIPVVGDADRITSSTSDTQLVVSDSIENNRPGIKLTTKNGNGDPEDVLFVDQLTTTSVQIMSAKQIGINSDVGFTVASGGVTQISTFKDTVNDQILTKANVGIIQENPPYGPFAAQQLVNKTYCDQKISQTTGDARYVLQTTPLNSILQPTGAVNMNNQLITNVACDGASNLQATNVLYVDNNYINKTQGVDQIKRPNNKARVHCEADNKITIRANDRDLGYFFQPVGQATFPMGLLSNDKLQFTSQLNSTAVYGGKTIDTSPVVLNTNLLNINSLDSASSNVQNMLQITSQYAPTMNIVSGHAINPLFSNANLPYSAINFEGSNSSVLYISPQGIADTNANTLIMVKNAYVQNPLNIGGGSLQNGFSMQTGYSTQITPTDSRSFATKKYVDDNIPNLASYSTTTQIKAFNDMTNYTNNTALAANYSTTAQVKALSDLTNYYTKTQGDTRYLQSLPEITALNNGANDSLVLTPGLLNLRLGTNVPYFQILNQGGTTEIYYKGQNTRFYGIDNTATSQVQQFGSSNVALKNMSLFQNTTEFGIQDSSGNTLIKFNPTVVIKTIVPTRMQTTLSRTGLTLDDTEFITKGDLTNGRATVSVSQSQVIQDSDIVLPGGKFFRQSQAPVLSQDVVTKGYFDSNAVSSTALNSYVKLASATTQQFDSDLIMGSSKVFTHNLSNAVQDANDTQIANVSYVKSKVSAGSGPMKMKSNFSVNLNPATNITGNYAASNVVITGNDASVSLNTIKYYVGNITGTNPTIVFYGGQTFGYEATFCFVFNDNSNLLTGKIWMCQLRDRYSGSTYDSATGWSVLSANNNVSQCVQVQHVTNVSHVWYNKTVVTVLLGQYQQATTDFAIDLLAF